MAVFIHDVAAIVKVLERGVSPAAVHLLAFGLERIAGLADVLAGLPVRVTVTIVVAIMIGIVVMVAVSVVVVVALAGIGVALAGAGKISIQVLNFAATALIIAELSITPLVRGVFAFGIQG